MADVEFSHDMGSYGHTPVDQPGEGTPGNSLKFMTNLAGAAVSLALIAGIGVWGYKLMVRDVSGIPIVRALSGEMRIRPEEPGGQLARHQGLSVNRVATAGTDEKPADQVILAPRTADLSEDDQPVTTAMVAPVQQPEPLSPATELAPVDDLTVATTKEPVDIAAALQGNEIDKIVAELTDSVEPLRVPEAETLPAAVIEETPVRAVLDAPGLKKSLRPALRPEGVRLIQAVATTSQDIAEVNAAEIPSGTRLAQLGAYDTAEIARAEWERMEARFGDYLQGKSRVVQQAQSGGRTFYRLRAMGFSDLSDARRFCSALVAEKADCIPVTTK